MIYQAALADDKADTQLTSRLTRSRALIELESGDAAAGDVHMGALAVEARDPADLDGWLDDKLARFKHPKDVVVLPELPRNASGKVVKGTLRQNDPKP